MSIYNKSYYNLTINFMKLSHGKIWRKDLLHVQLQLLKNNPTFLNFPTNDNFLLGHLLTSSSTRLRCMADQEESGLYVSVVADPKSQSLIMPESLSKRFSTYS